jgi:pimeloyl-ACP methyl ester carboxylesterase
MSGGRGGLLRLGIVGLGVAGAGVIGGVAAERALVRRLRQAPDPAEGEDQVVGSEVVAREVVTADGTRLRILDHGTGRPVLLLHGVTLSADIWHYQLDELARAGFRVLALDLRGHGRSEAGKARLTLARLAGDVEEVLRRLDLDDVVLVGHSMGGMVALRYLSADPGRAAGRDRVSALALVATSASPVGGSGVPGAAALATVVRPLAARSAWLTSRLPGPSLPGNDLAFLLTRVVFGDQPSATQVALTEKITGDVPARVTAELLADIVGFDGAAALDRVELPSTVVVGTNDVMTPIRHARAVVGRIGGAELIVLEGCGHMVMLERHEELSEALVALAGRSVTGRSAGGRSAGGRSAG